MLNIQTWWDTTLNSVTSLWGDILEFALPIIGALIILYIGWLAGKLAERIIRLVATNMSQTDAQIAKSGFGQFLTSLGTSFSIGAILGWLSWAVKWFLYVSFFMSAMSVLTFTSVNTFIGSTAASFPEAAVGALFIFVGVILARFLQSVLQTLLSTFKLPGSEITGTVAYWVVFIFAFLAMLNHFALPLDALWAKTLDLLVIAGGIAIGLGFSGKFAELRERFKL